MPKLSVVTEFSGTARPEATPARALRPAAAPPVPRQAPCGEPTVPLARADARPLATGTGPRPPEGHPAPPGSPAAHQPPCPAHPPSPEGPSAALPTPVSPSGATTAPRPVRWEPATAPIPAVPAEPPGPIIDAAAALVAEHGARGLRVADVASRAGVSRQTVYNAHGNKQRLVEAVALVKAAEFVDAARACLARAPGAVEGVAEAVRQVHALTRLDPLARSVLTGTDADDMLPMLTTRGGWVLDLVAPVVGEHLARHRPDLPPARIAFAADVLTRLALSHLLTPDHGADRAVDRAVDLAVEAVTGVAVALLGPSPRRAG